MANPYAAGPLLPHSNLAGPRCRDCQRGKLRFQARAHSRIRPARLSRGHRRKTTASGIPANAIRNLPGGLAARENWQPPAACSTGGLCLMFRLIARALVAVQTEPNRVRHFRLAIETQTLLTTAAPCEQERRNIQAIGVECPVLFRFLVFNLLQYYLLLLPRSRKMLPSAV